MKICIKLEHFRHSMLLVIGWSPFIRWESRTTRGSSSTTEPLLPVAQSSLRSIKKTSWKKTYLFLAWIGVLVSKYRQLTTLAKQKDSNWRQLSDSLEKLQATLIEFCSLYMLVLTLKQHEGSSMVQLLMMIKWPTGEAFWSSMNKLMTVSLKVCDCFSYVYHQVVHGQWTSTSS